MTEFDRRFKKACFSLLASALITICSAGKSSINRTLASSALGFTKRILAAANLFKSKGSNMRLNKKNVIGNEARSWS